MAGAEAGKRRPLRRRWRNCTQRLPRRLLCCSCLRAEEGGPLQEQEEKLYGGPRLPRSDQRGSGETEVIQITVEDLGMVNGSFSLLEEEPLTSRSTMARSASSASACPRALKKKRVKPLSSLPIQPQGELAIVSTSDDEEDEQLLFESGTDSTPASGSLLRPVINLIPPTPSDVADDDQFFDVYSEESVAHVSSSDGSFGAGGQERMERMERAEEEEPPEEPTQPESRMSGDEDAGSTDSLSDPFREERPTEPTTEGGQETQTKSRFFCRTFQVEFPQKLSFNTGIDLLSFTEHNLDDLSSRGQICADVLRADLHLLPNTNMDSFTQQRSEARFMKQRLITRSCSLEDRLTRSATFHALTQTSEHKDEEGTPRERRVTVASCTPQSTDQNGNFPEKQDADSREARCLREMNTEEVCQWFVSIRLQKCLPFIKEAKLCGADIASVDLDTLDILHISSLEERELLLSAIYNQLHPPNSISQRLDSLLESLGPDNVEAFTATLVSMSKSKSSPHVSCLSMNRRSLKLRNNSPNITAQKTSQLIEITINASERIVHLRTPKETTVGKIMDSCLKMLGMTEDKSLFILKEKDDSPEELPLDQQIGILLTSTSENTQLELHMCKKVRSNPASQDNHEVNTAESCNKNIQVTQPAKEERIRELNQQVDSLQNVILQVQELHHGLVAFCSELKSMDSDVSVDRLSAAELKQRLELVKSRLTEKKQSLQELRDQTNNSAAHKRRQTDVRLLEKMKLNCQVFKEEISIVHLTRQVAHLQSALQESCVKEKARTKRLAVGSLTQLVSPQSPAMLLVVQENQTSDGCYGFTCCRRERSGLVVVRAGSSHLCVDDRLVEVNGVPVINSTAEELTDILLQGPSAQIVVLRQPPPSLPTPPPLLQHMVSPDPPPPVWTENTPVPAETPPQRKVMAI